ELKEEVAVESVPASCGVEIADVRVCMPAAECMRVPAESHREYHSRAFQHSSFAIALDYQIPTAVSGKFESFWRDCAELHARAVLSEPQIGVPVSEDGAGNFPGRSQGQNRLFNLHHKRSIRRAGEAQRVYLV